MVVTKRAIVWTTTAGNKTTAAFTPAANDLLVAFVGLSGTDSAPTLSDSQGGSWSQIGAMSSFSTVLAGGLRMFVRTTAVAASSMTVTMTSPGGDTGGGLAVLSVSPVAAYGASAVRATGGAGDRAAGGTPAVQLDLTPLSTSAILSAIMDNTNGTANAVPRTGYTEEYDQGYNTPPAGIEVNSLGSGETSNVITYAGTTPSQYGQIALEILAGATTYFGAASLSSAVGVTTAATRQTFGAVSRPETVSLVTAGVRETRAASSVAETVSITTSGTVTAGGTTYFGATSLTAAVTVTTAATRTTFASATSTSTLSAATVGTRATFASATSALTVSAQTVAARTTFATLAVAETATISTAGTVTSGGATYLGATSLTLTVAAATSGARTTFGSLQTTETAGVQTVGRITAFGRSTLTETVSITTRSGPSAAAQAPDDFAAVFVTL